MKQYGGLRPLRIVGLDVAAGETVVVEGPDEAAASVLVDLVTGTTLPDAGAVVVGGRDTSSIADHHAWLGFLEQFGLVGPRVVLLDALTTLQNVAVPITLDLDPLPEAARARAAHVAATVGLDVRHLQQRLASASGLTRFRVRLARAIAHDPAALLLEHPTLGLAADEVVDAAASLRAVAAGRGIAVLCISGDARFAEAAGGRRLALAAGSGTLADRRARAGWFRGR